MKYLQPLNEFQNLSPFGNIVLREVESEFDSPAIYKEFLTLKRIIRTSSSTLSISLNALFSFQKTSTFSWRRTNENPSSFPPARAKPARWTRTRTPQTTIERLGVPIPIFYYRSSGLRSTWLTSGDFLICAIEMEEVRQ